MFGWFRRKPVAPPGPPPPQVFVRATGTAATSRARYKGPTVQRVMEDAVNEAHKAGEGNDSAKMSAWIAGARATHKAALAEMAQTGKPVTFTVGTMTHTVEPGE